MKIPVTDAFLWDLYYFFQESGDLLKTVFNPHPRIGDFWAEKNPVFEKYRKEKGAREFAKLVYYLKRKNYIKIQIKNGTKAILITKRGASKALKASFKSGAVPKRKDGKWVMLIFDIPQRNVKSRDLLRTILFNLGYKLFQQSVWVSPYDIAEKTETLLQIHSLDRYVKMFLIEKL